jgi:hypothetical protein
VCVGFMKDFFATYGKYLTCLIISASCAKIFPCAVNESYLLTDCHNTHV